jgi:xyloglucan-specific endo-beta-1,4-glucanase
MRKGNYINLLTARSANCDTSYSGSDVVADVSYDAFITSTDSTDTTASYEVMIWLGALGGAGPISSTGYTPIATPVIGGITWNLFKGPNTWTVFSFVASTQQNDFSGDVMDFFNYLIDNQGVPSDYYLESIQAGTEPFIGSNALLTVSPFSLSLNTISSEKVAETSTCTSTKI